MKIDFACLDCIVNQSQRVADAIGAKQVVKQRMKTETEMMTEHFDFTKSPPEVAAGVYEHLAEIANKRDLYDEVKLKSTEHAKSMVPQLRRQIDAAEDKLLAAVKVAVAGNVIDLASEVEFDVNEEIATVFETEFAHDHYKEFSEKLTSARTLVYLGDNAGEHIFDGLALETISAMYPALKIYFMTRGKPIINDVTYDEALRDGLDAYARLIDSGVDTPGFLYSHASPIAQRLFDHADLVLSKGMGNYECLSPAPREGICYLLKVKCNVVAESIKADVGDIICKVV